MEIKTYTLIATNNELVKKEFCMRYGVSLTTMNVITCEKPLVSDIDIDSLQTAPTCICFMDENGKGFRIFPKQFAKGGNIVTFTTARHSYVFEHKYILDGAVY